MLVEKTCEAKSLLPRCKSLQIERRQHGNAPESRCHPISLFLRSWISSRLITFPVDGDILTNEIQTPLELVHQRVNSIILNPVDIQQVFGTPSP